MMSVELNIILHNQLDVILHRFLHQQNETTENSQKAIDATLSSIVAALLMRVNGNPNQALSLHEQIYGTKGTVFDGMAAQTAADQIHFDELNQMGTDLLPLIFEHQSLEMAQKIASHSGIQSLTAPALLAIATPLVLSVLRGLALDSRAWLTLLGAQQSWLLAALPSSLQSALGIGSISGLSASVASMVAHIDAVNASPTVATSSQGGLRAWWSVGVVFIAAIWALRACSPTAETAHQPSSAVQQSDAQHIVASDTADTAAGTAMMNMATETLSSPQTETAAASVIVVDADDEPTSIHEANANNADDIQAASTVALVNQADASNNKKARVVMEQGVAKFYFASGFSRIAKGADKTVADVIAAGKSGKTLVISGFTDSTGNAKSNARLSKKRAQVVRDFFIERGVKAQNIKLQQPENITGAQGKNQEGRRVDVKVMD